MVYKSDMQYILNLRLAVSDSLGKRQLDGHFGNFDLEPETNFYDGKSPQIYGKRSDRISLQLSNAS
jgi:hypothetical protein